MRVSLTGLAFAFCFLQNAVSFAPQSQIALKTSSRTTKQGVLFAVPNNEEEEKSTALFSAVSPDNEDNKEQARPTPTQQEAKNSFELQTIGTQAVAALFAVLVFLGAASLAMDMATSAAGALGNELVKETQNLLGNIAWALGAIGSSVAGAAWEGIKIAAPAVGKAVVEGAKVAAPVVQEATRQVTEAAAPVVQEAATRVSEAATPVVQEAAKQVTEAAAPYVDSVSSAVADSVSSAASTVDSTLVAPLNTAMDSVNSAVDSSLVAPIKDAAETVSNTVESVNSKVDETVLAPIKSVGDVIKGFKMF